MTRGATPYDQRGMPLVLPKGSIQNPSLRFWKERSGLYLGGDGVLGVTLKTYKALELTEDGASIHAQTLGAGNVTPLSLVRVNATTADGEETQTDYYETVLPIARAAVYRQSASRYGFKWYGFNAGLHATPALTLSGDKDLTVGRDLIVTRNVIMSAGGLGLAPTAHNTGLYLGADTFTPSVRLGNNDVEGDSTNRLEIGLNVGAATLGGNIGDSVVRTAGASAGRLLLAPNGVARLTLATDGAATFGGPSVAVSPATGPASIGTAPLQANQNSHLVLTSNTNAQLAWLTLQGGPTAFPAGWGAAIGDVSLYTNVGALRLGTSNTPRLEINAAGVGTYRLAAGANNLFQVLNAAATTAIFRVTDAGAIGLQPNSVGTPQIQDGSITAAKMVGGTLAYLPLVGGTLSGPLTIDKAGATSATDWQGAGIQVVARGSGLAGISFHRPGLFAAMLHESAGQLRWGADLMWTDANVTAAVINGKLGYTPVNKAGDTMTGNLTLNAGATLAAGASLVGSGGISLNRPAGTGHGAFIITNEAGSFPLLLHNSAVNGYGMGIYNQNQSNWDFLVNHAGASFGVVLSAPRFTATTTTLCDNLNAQYLNGKTDTYLVPSGVRAFFPNAASIPPGWLRDTNADGRLIAGSGASFSGITFNEYSHNGNNTWTPSAGVGVNAGTLKTVASTTAAWGGGQAGATAGGLNLDPLGHNHAIPILSMSGAPALSGTTSVWVPPLLALVMAYKQ